MGGGRGVLLFLRILYWQSVVVLAFNHCDYRHSAGHISYEVDI